MKEDRGSNTDKQLLVRNTLFELVEIRHCANCLELDSVICCEVIYFAMGRWVKILFKGDDLAE